MAAGAGRARDFGPLLAAVQGVAAVGAGALGLAAVGGGIYFLVLGLGEEVTTFTGLALGVLGAIVANTTKVGGLLRRRLTRAFVLAVTIPPSPDLEMQVEQRLHYGIAFSIPGFWRWRPITDRYVPRLLRRLGPAPWADGGRIEPPLCDEDFRLRAFRSVAIVLDQESSQVPVAWEHDLIDVTVGSAWRCVWLRNVSPATELSWPEPRVALRVPEEWIGTLKKAYEPLLGGPVAGPPGVGLVEVSGQARIDHQIGLPVDTRSGPVLQVTQGDDVRTGREQSFSPSYGPGYSAPETSAWLTVVQVTPTDGPFYRDASTAALTRRLALDCQRETGAWVLALPAVPPSVAEEIWGLLGRFARRKRPARWWHLITCVGEIKRVIVEGPADVAPEETSSARQVAQDVLLIGPWWAS
jgi:hypothetical protein